MTKLVCLYCRKILKNRWQTKYCSNQCQADQRYKNFKQLWIGGIKQVKTLNTSHHIKRYLLDKFANQCSQCGWNKKHPVTHRVPLEVDHISGNADDNSLSNLRLLCPNCHALTPSFRNLNKGKGRAWRRLKPAQ